MVLRTYEALYIVTPELEDDDIRAVSQEVEALVTQNGGEIVRSEIWGKRKLAYMVKKHAEGAYILLRFTANADFITRLEGYFRLSEQVIRYVVVCFDERTLRLEAEQQRQREEELRAGSAAHGRGRRGDDDDEDDDDEPLPVGARRPSRFRDDDDDDDDDD